MSTPSQQPATLRSYLQVLWRRKWIVVQAVVLVPLIAIIVSFTQPKRYDATARVMGASQATVVSAATGTNLDWQTIDERQLETLATFVATPDIATRALARLGWDDDPAEVLQDIKAEADPNANIIEITARRADPAEASDLANAFAGEFVSWRQQAQRGSVDEAVQLVEQQIRSTPKDTLTYSALLDRRSQLEVIKALVTGDVVIGESAQRPAAPAIPKPLRNAAIALAVGLVVGVGLAFLRESLDVKVHSVDQITEALDMPLLGSITQFDGAERGDNTMVVLDDPRGPAAEAYRFLRTNLEFVNFAGDVRTIIVTSPQPGQGKSTTIANLAITLLRAGRRVAVVEGDLRRPSLHRFFKVRNTLGVTTVVSGATGLDEALNTLTFTETPETASAAATDRTDGPKAPAAHRPGGQLRLHILTSGPVPPNPGEMATSDQLTAILAELRETHDYVLVDAPPMFVVGDAAALAGKVDGIVIVLRYKQTTTNTLAAVAEFVKRIPTRTLGTVITAAPRKARGGSYRYGEYYE